MNRKCVPTLLCHRHAVGLAIALVLGSDGGVGESLRAARNLRTSVPPYRVGTNSVCRPKFRFYREFVPAWRPLPYALRLPI